MADFIEMSERYAAVVRRVERIRAQKTRQPTIRIRFVFAPQAAERNVPQLEQLARVCSMMEHTDTLCVLARQWMATPCPEDWKLVGFKARVAARMLKRGWPASLSYRAHARLVRIALLLSVEDWVQPDKLAEDCAILDGERYPTRMRVRGHEYRFYGLAYDEAGYPRYRVLRENDYVWQGAIYRPVRPDTPILHPLSDMDEILFTDDGKDEDDEEQRWREMWS